MADNKEMMARIREGMIKKYMNIYNLNREEATKLFEEQDAKLEAYIRAKIKEQKSG